MAFGKGWLRAALALSLVLSVAALCACDRIGSGGSGLLAGVVPAVSGKVDRVSQLTDGVAVRDGDTWNTHRTTVLRGSQASLTYDLGSSQPIRAAWLHADNNDQYQVSISDDGNAFTPLWVAPPVSERGMRERFSAELTGSGRYVRLSASGGDGSYALSELMLFSEPPASFPPDVARRAGYPVEERARSSILVFAVALLAFAMFARGTNKGWWLLMAALPVVAGYQMYDAISQTWPPPQRVVALMRGTVAAVAGLIVMWEVFAPKRLAPDGRAVVSSLGVLGVLGVLCFYNLGHPQFYDAKRDQWSFVHHLDLRQYYGTAKYFPEISYWKLYEADVAAYSEEAGVPLDSIPNQVLRDLHTNRPSTVAERRGSIEQIKQRFSPERWEQYKSDARFFRDTMGTRHWLETMVDLGGNATPVWISIAYFLFNALPLTYESLFGLSLLDPLLFLALFVAIGRSFGLRSMFVVMVMFGANDFIMYGTNWGGAYLRHDWLVLIGLGICALKAERWVLAGIAFGLATSIRAFPAFAVIGMCIPALWWIGEEWWKSKRFPGLKAIIQAQRPTFVAGLSSVITVAALVLVTSLILGFSAWPEWVKKVDLLDAEPHVNPISLKTVIAGTEDARHRLLRARWPLYAAALVAYIGMLLVVARKKRLEQAATLGLIFLPLLMFPANYYIHVVMLLPLVVIDWRSIAWRKWRKAGKKSAWEPPRPLDSADAWAWFALLSICAVQYFTTFINEFRLHFYMSSVALMGGLAVMLASLTRRDGPAALALLTPLEAEPAAAPDAAALPESKPPPASEPDAEPSSETSGEPSSETSGEPSSESAPPASNESGDGERPSRPKAVGEAE